MNRKLFKKTKIFFTFLLLQVFFLANFSFAGDLFYNFRRETVSNLSPQLILDQGVISNFFIDKMLASDLSSNFNETKEMKKIVKESELININEILEQGELEQILETVGGSGVFKIRGLMNTSFTIWFSHIFSM